MGCPSGQCPIRKWRPPCLCSKKTKWWTDKVVTKLLILEEKGWVISDKNYSGGTKQYCLNTKQQITLKWLGIGNWVNWISFRILIQVTWNFRVNYYWDDKHEYKLQLHGQLSGLSKQFLCSRPLEEDKKKQFFYIFLFWPNWTHVLADSQSAWRQIHANILGSFTIWIFTVVTAGSTPLYKP